MDAAVLARRSRLLEFLKFRVLAAQAEFFTAFADPVADELTYRPGTIREYLAIAHPESLALQDEDLVEVFRQARRLYLP